MSNIDTFMTTWEGQSTEQEGSKARSFGSLNVQLSKSGRDNVVRLNVLQSNDLRNGEAGKFMSWLAEQSDSGGFLVTLCAQQFGVNRENTMDRDKLVAWSKKFGFVERYTYPDKSGIEMARCPNGDKSLLRKI